MATRSEAEAILRWHGLGEQWSSLRLRPISDLLVIYVAAFSAVAVAVGVLDDAMAAAWRLLTSLSITPWLLPPLCYTDEAGWGP